MNRNARASGSCWVFARVSGFSVFLGAQVCRRRSSRSAALSAFPSDTLLRSVAQVQTVLRDALAVALVGMARWSMSICVSPEAFCTRWFRPAAAGGCRRSS